MPTAHNMEEQLWNYIDGLCNEAEKELISRQIAIQLEWRNKYQELLDVHQLMRHSLELEEPSMRFTQNVMESIAVHQIAPATKNYINKKIIYGIGGFFLVLMAGMLVYAFAQVNWTATDASNHLLTKYNFNYSKFFNSTNLSLFMMANMILGLVLLDMWLGKKRKSLRKEI